MSQATTSVPLNPLSDQLRSLLALKKPEFTSVDLDLVFSSFRTSSSSADKAEQTKCTALSHLLLLSAYPSQPAPSIETVKLLEQSLTVRLSGTDANDLEEAFKGLSALLKVSPSVGINLLVGTPETTNEGALRRRLEESVEFVARGGTSKTKGKGPRMALVEMLSYAATHSETRKMVRRHAGQWLGSLLRIGEIDDEEEEMTRALAGVAVVKLLLASDKPADPGLPTEKEEMTKLSWSANDLVALFRDMAIAASTRLGSSANAILVTALEALTYLMYSSSSDRKSLLTTRSFLKMLFSTLPALAPTLSSVTAPSPEEGLEFSIASLIAALSAYPVVDSPGSSAEQLSRLKAFATAKARQQPSATAPMVETSLSVDTRISLLLASPPSPLPTLVHLARSASPQIRHLASAACLGMAEQAKHRGQLIQGGIAKALLNICRRVTLPLDPDDLNAIQALAKLLITTSPVLVLGPTTKSEYLVEALNSLILPLAINDHGEDRIKGLLLIRFECMMALTNIASLQTTLAERIAGKLVLNGNEDSSARAGRLLLHLVEELMVNDNTLVRRAATQFMCNLAFTRAGASYYVPDAEVGAKASTTLPPRLRLLVTLASSAMDDVLTRISAAGALAILLIESGPLVSASLSAQLAHSPEAMGKILGLIELHERDEMALNESHKNDLRQRGYAILASIFSACAAMTQDAKEAVAVVFNQVKLSERLSSTITDEQDEMIKGLNSECRDAFNAAAIV